MSNVFLHFYVASRSRVGIAGRAKSNLNRRYGTTARALGRPWGEAPSLATFCRVLPRRVVRSRARYCDFDNHRLHFITIRSHNAAEPPNSGNISKWKPSQKHKCWLQKASWIVILPTPCVPVSQDSFLFNVRFTSPLQLQQPPLFGRESSLSLLLSQ